MKNSIHKKTYDSINYVKCDFCSHVEDFTLKKYIDHLDAKHRDVSVSKQKKSLSNISKRIFRTQNTIQIVSPEVNKYLGSIASYIDKYLDSEQLRLLYAQHSLEHLNLYMVNFLPSKGKDELRNLGIDIYRNNDLDRRFSETGKYKYWVTVFSARM